MRYIYIAIIALLTVSCTETKMLQKSLNKYNAPIGYLHDSKKINYPVTDSLIINLNNKSLDSLTSVTKTGRLVLPFIVFNYSELNMNVKLGQKSIQQEYNDFFVNSLIDESKRTGCFGITNKRADDSTYTLDITIDSCITNSNYRESSTVIFLLFAYSMSYNEIGFPAETNLQVSTRLKKGDSVIAEKKYSIKRTQPFLYTRNTNVDKLRSEFISNMVESLSLCTKQCIEDMIIDINNSLTNKNTYAKFPY